MLRADGSPYTTAGKLQQYNPGSNNHKLFDIWDQAAIKQGGSPIYYSEVFIPTAVIDTDYLEARGKLWSPNPIELWCFYEPITSQNYMNSFGFDSPDDVIFELNVKATLAACGHMPRLGSRIFTPHLGEYWKIIQRNLGEFKMWGALRLQLICRRWQDSVTDNSTKIPTPPTTPAL